MICKTYKIHLYNLCVLMPALHDLYLMYCIADLFNVQPKLGCEQQGQEVH